MTNKKNVRQKDRAPRRRINKQEAIRHLLHSAVRLIMTGEDPFAIHLLGHSAEKMILDIAKSRGVYPRFDWELYIKDQHHREFFKQHRQVYNYFKHADTDFNEDLPVHDIMMLNVMTIFIAIMNYSELFKETSSHMGMFITFALLLQPGLIGPKFPNREVLLENLQGMYFVTPRDFFETFKSTSPTMPEFRREQRDDLQDVTGFYKTSIADVRAGKTTRTMKVPV